MTATVNDTCTIIEVGSTHFNITNLSNVLTVTVNGEDYEVEIPTETTTTYEVTPEDLGLEEFPVGVYALSLVTTDEDSATTTESLCRVLLCGEECTVLPMYADVDNFAKAMAYEGLKLVNECVDCSCSLANTLYTTYTDTPDVNSCNCQ